MSYLDPTEAKLYFSKFPSCKLFIDCIDDFIPLVDSLMNEWLGRSLEVTEYCEERSTNHKGSIVLWQFPVVSLISVEVVDLTIVQEGSQTIVDQLDPYSLYDGGSTLHTGNCDCARFNYIIKYTAGYEPLPASTKTVAQMVLQEMLETGSPKVLMQTPKELVEAQNPSVGGAFKQRFQRGTTKGTLLDQLMVPLARYKQNVFVG